MNEYEVSVYHDILRWKKKLLKDSSMLQRVSKKAQVKVNELIPDQVHHVITESMKQLVQTTLTGTNFMTKKNQAVGLSLKDKDQMAIEKLSFYRKTATIEGAGTGAGGLFLGLADFPLLLTIKMKYLSETAAVYGFNLDDYEERVFMLHVFLLAYSSEGKRREIFQVIEEWEDRKHELMNMDWRVFQQEYRDYIDFVKMLQLVPGIGAVVGAYANYNLLDKLGEAAMNCYRLRIIQTAPTID